LFAFSVRSAALERDGECMIFYGKSDVGKKRDVNEDFFVIKTYCGDVALLVVCDGMGGAQAGEEASRTATQTFVDMVDQLIGDKLACNLLISEDETLRALESAVLYANRAVHELSKSTPSLSGMGTTLVSAVVTNDMLYAVNVGDSRLYLLTENEAKQITRDHSYVQYLLDIGALTEEEAASSSRRNIITRAVGTEEDVVVDTFTVSLHEKFYILLCTDGLSNYLDSDDLHRTLWEEAGASAAEEETVRGKVEMLIEKANESGGSDNITAVIAKK